MVGIRVLRGRLDRSSHQGQHGGLNNPDAKFFPGWAITAIAWPYYLTNLTIIFSPLIFLLAARWRKARACYGILLILYLIPPPTLLIPGNRDSILEIG